MVVLGQHIHLLACDQQLVGLVHVLLIFLQALARDVLDLVRHLLGGIHVSHRDVCFVPILHFIERRFERLVIHEWLQVLLPPDELDVFAVHRVHFRVQIVQVAPGFVFVVP